MLFNINMLDQKPYTSLSIGLFFNEILDKGIGI
jgi:hypothetical protein